MRKSQLSDAALQRDMLCVTQGFWPCKYASNRIAQCSIDVRTDGLDLADIRTEPPCRKENAPANERAGAEGEDARGFSGQVEVHLRAT
ncbi:hypothetical protein Rmet_4681 (plasmid) [Cupriavidus metallidurans CH34]|uniref:Uncharacterized protein n=1 Tax=Cupriavidus metallidurans (strain ATCC 43123 / DSM 2839 / NBRC 102507 / CH34) TaxID=266264 RepID=Q1LE83_CUPMC|nr:hypothetical protein Rmet_4681 [Cupriavidus metallidurans CH34]